MKKLLLLNLLLLLLSWSINAQTATPPSAGDGSGSNPYEIATLENLYWIAASDAVVASPSQTVRLAAYYKQTANIDASSTIAWNGGKGWVPIGNTWENYFTGNYDGNGKTISGLRINNEIDDFFGLFGYAFGATFQNIGIININILNVIGYAGGLVGYTEDVTINDCYSSGLILAHSSGYLSAGGLVGSLNTNSVMLNCYSSCSVSGGNTVGGLAGFNFKSTISKCHYINSSVLSAGVSGTVTGGLVATNQGSISECYAVGSLVTGYDYTGGLVGFNDTGASITNCYGRCICSNDEVYGAHGGGLVGINKGLISNCYCPGKLESNMGGFVGINNGTIEHSFWNTDVAESGATWSSGGTGINTTLLKTISTYTDAGWDFTTIWGMDAAINDGYPSFKPASVCSDGTIALTSATETANQFICANTAITSITYSVGGGATGAEATGLPDGVTGNFSGSTFTISGTPTVAGTYPFTVTTTGTPSPCNEATASGTLTVNASVTPSVTINSSDDDNQICLRTGVTFTAFPENTGGGTVAYKWIYNDIPYDTWNESFKYMDELEDGDKVSCQITITGGTCLASTTDVSNEIITTVYDPIAVPSVTITSSDDDNVICDNNTEVTFTAFPVNTNGGNIFYQWKYNDTSIGVNQNSYTSWELEDGDKVSCQIIITEASCFTTAMVASNEIVTTVIPDPSVTIVSDIAGDADITICAGTNVTFTATPQHLNGGTVAYRWAIIYPDEDPIFVSEQNTYSSSSLEDGAMIICGITVDGGTCPLTNETGSNWITVTVNPSPTATQPAGDGSSEYPYEIATLENLYWIAVNPLSWAGYFIQTTDIDASATADWCNGGWFPIGFDYDNKFSGNYDGRGHSISGLYITNSSAECYGLFGHAKNAAFQNLGITDVYIEGAAILSGTLLGYGEYVSINNCYSTGVVKGNTNLGGLVGGIYYNSILENSYSTCEVIGIQEVGGLVGLSFYSCKIINCYHTTGVVSSTSYSSGGLVATNYGSLISKCFSTGQVMGNYHIGGLVGWNDSNASISDCFSRCTILNTSSIIDNFGGLVGVNTYNSIINNCYSAGSVQAGMGGLVGVQDEGATTTHSFWDTQTSGTAASAAGEGKTTEEMKTLTTFTNPDVNWDFTTIWGMNVGWNDSYPYLVPEILRQPSVTIISDPSGEVCATQDVTFTAIPESPCGGDVSYKWNHNGFLFTGNQTITLGDLEPGDVVSCEITVTNASCFASGTASSNVIAIADMPDAGVISVAEGDNVIEVGEQIQLTSTEPGGNWVRDEEDKDIVSVDFTTGVVTGIGAGTATIYYGVPVQAEPPCYYEYGLSEFQITVTAGQCTNPTSGGEISGNQTICSGSDPTAFTSISEASGYTGTLEYKWQYSDVNDPFDWEDLSSSNSAGYDDSQTTSSSRWYRRLARVDFSADWTGAAESNVLEVLVKPQPTLTSFTVDKESECEDELLLTGTVTSIFGGLLNAENSINVTAIENGDTENAYTGDVIIPQSELKEIDGYFYFETAMCREPGSYQIILNSITVNGCTTTFDENNKPTVSWIINPLPDASFAATPSNSPVCESENAEFYLTGTANSVISYSITDIYGETNNTVTLAASGEATVVVSGAFKSQTMTLNSVLVPATGCTRTLSATEMVEVKPLPYASFDSPASNSPVCSGEDTHFYITGTPGSRVTFRIEGSAINTIRDLDETGKLTITIEDVTSDISVNLISIEYPDGMCPVGLEQSSTVVVNPLPTLSRITVDNAESCYGTDVTVTIDGLVAGPNTVNYDLSINGEGPINYNLDITASEEGVYSFEPFVLPVGTYTLTIKTIKLGSLAEGEEDTRCIIDDFAENSVSWIVTSCCTNPTIGGEISGNQTICSGSDPTAFTSISEASGYTGTLEYKWQYSDVNDPYDWEDLSSSNSACYDDSQTTSSSRWYRRLARVDCSADWTGAAESNVITVTVDEVDAGIMVYGPTTFCEGSSVTLAALGGNSWLWSNAETTQEITVTTSGDYFVTITNENGCSASTSASPVTVIVNPMPTISGISADNESSCYDPDADPILTFSGLIPGENNIFYAINEEHINEPLELVADDNGNATHSFDLGVGTFVFSIDEIRVNGGCKINPSENNSVTWTVYAIPEANAGSGGDVCGLGFVLTATPSVGTGTWTQESGPGTADFNTNSNDPYATITVTEYGTYIFRWTEENGPCSDFAEVTINFYQDYEAYAGEDQSQCNNSTFTIGPSTKAAIIGPSGSWEFIGENGGALIEDKYSETTTVTDVPFAQDITLRWTLTNGPCSDFDDVVLRNNSLPTVDAGTYAAVCEDADDVVLVGSPERGIWEGTGVSGNQTDGYFFDPTGHVGYNTLTYTYSGDNGCSNSDQTTIRVYYLPDCLFYEPGSVDGDPVLPNSTHFYTTHGEGIYKWTIEGNGRIIGYDDKELVEVIAGENCNEPYTLSLTVTNNVTQCSSTCSKEINVNDTEGPYLVDPLKTSASLDSKDNNWCLEVADAFDGSTLQNNVKALYTDNGGAVGVICTSKTAMADNSNCSWTITYHYQVQDGCSNSTTCDVTYSGGDTEVPVAVCKNIIVSLDENGEATISDDAVNNGSSDNCSSALSFDTDITSFGCSNVGANTVVLKVTDDCYLSSTCNATVTVEDKIAPVITCAPNITQTTDAGQSYATITVVPPTATDCDNHVLPVSNNELIKNGNFNAGVSNWQDCGNTAEVNTEEYYIVPLPDPSSNFVAEIDKGVSLCQNISGFTPGHKYVLTFKASRRQNTGTPNPVSANVMIDGDALSKVVTRTNTIFDLTFESFEFIATQETHKLTFKPYADNIYTLGLIVDDVSLRSITYPVGTTTLVWTATDVYGNTNTCEQDITVTDDEVPTITAPDDVTIQCSDDPDNLTLTGDVTDEADNCGFAVDADQATYSDYESGLTGCNRTGTIIRTWSLTDAAGNTTTHNQIIAVQDNTNPTATASAGYDLECADDLPDAAETIAEFLALDEVAAAADNCTVTAELTISHSDVVTTAGNCEGVITRTYTITDGCTNSVNVYQVFNVTDNTNPTAICRNIEVTLAQDGTVSIEENAVNNGSSDNCTSDSNLEFNTDVTFFDCTNIGANQVEMTVADECGNSSACKAVVTVVPYTAATEVSVWPDPQQYSDKATFTATVSPASVVSGCVAATQVTFWVGSQQMGPAVALTNGMVSIDYPLTELPSWPSNGQMAPGLHEVKAVFGGVDPAFIVPDASTTLIINQENVIIDYIGTNIVGEANPDVNTTPVQLVATITDIADAYGGDIRNARVRFMNGSTPIPGCDWLTPTLVNPADLTQGIVSFVWDAPVPTVGYTTYEIGIQAGTQSPAEADGYYKGYELTTLNVYRTSLNEFITGGGHILPVDSKGEYASDPGRKTNFGFNVKWNKTMKNLQGNFNLILRRGSEIYQIKSNALSGLGIDGSNPCSHKAVLTAKANLNRVTGGITETLMGNLSLQVALTDNGEPGVVDRIGVTLYNGSTLLYSSNWPVSSTEELTLVGGNILVHDGLICNASDITHTVVTSDKNPSLTGEDATFTATVYGNDGIPQGDLYFTINGETFAGTLDSKGSASVDYSFDEAGIYEVEADYNSTNGYQPSTGTITQLVSGSSFVLTSSKNPSVFGDELTFTAVLNSSGAAPAGTVIFNVDGEEKATDVPLADKKATFTTNSLSSGSHTIEAVYTSTNDPLIVVEPATLTQVVNNISISLTSSRNPSVITETVVFTATVTGSASIGETVVFYKDGSEIGTGIVDVNGNAMVSHPFGTAGTYVISAECSGKSVTLSVVVANPVVALFSSLNPSAENENVTFTATVIGASEGTVRFTNGQGEYSTLLNDGKATWTIPLTEGSYLIKAEYFILGNLISEASLTQVVTAENITVELVSSKPLSVVYGTNITYTATVNGSVTAPSGTITFKDGPIVLKNVLVSGGKASFSINKLAVGYHPITATYNLTGTVSDTIPQTIATKTKSSIISSDIEPEVELADLKVYPNPFSDRLKFEFSSPVDTKVQILMYDITGKLVHTVFDAPAKQGVSYNVVFKPESEISGIYIYRMIMGDSIFTGKAIYKKNQ